MESTTGQISSGFKNCHLWVHLFVFSSRRLGLSLSESPWEGAGVIRSLEGPLPLPSASRPPRVPSGGPAVGECPCGHGLHPPDLRLNADAGAQPGEFWVGKGSHC